MKKNLVFLALLALSLTVLAAHPHFQRTSSVTLAQGQEISLSHVTYPWNEANPDRIPPQGWDIGGATLDASMELSSGSTSIPAGKYNLRLTKEGADYQMHLVNGDQDYALNSETERGLSMQDHLMIDLHVTGGSSYLDLRFGTFNIRGKITNGE